MPVAEQALKKMHSISAIILKVLTAMQKQNVEQGGICYITHKKLLKGANLHHLDLDENKYSDISKPENFVYLNKSLHEVVHVIWRYYKNDPEVLDRLKDVLDKMLILNTTEAFDKTPTN